jgi:alkylation response protein AidB-like acyl-CoA dehydrogenase
MDFKIRDGGLAFHAEVRQFIQENLPAGLADKVRRSLHLGKGDFNFWQKKLNQKGWFAPIDRLNWVGGLDPHAALPVPERTGGRQLPASHSLRRAHGRPCHLHLWQRRSETTISARYLG